MEPRDAIGKKLNNQRNGHRTPHLAQSRRDGDRNASDRGHAPCRSLHLYEKNGGQSCLKKTARDHLQKVVPRERNGDRVEIQRKRQTKGGRQQGVLKTMRVPEETERDPPTTMGGGTGSRPELLGRNEQTSEKGVPPWRKIGGTENSSSRREVFDLQMIEIRLDFVLHYRRACRRKEGRGDGKIGRTNTGNWGNRMAGRSYWSADSARTTKILTVAA